MNQNLYGTVFGVALLFTIGVVPHYAQARYQVFKMTKVENPPGHTERVGYTKRLIRLLLVQPGHHHKAEEHHHKAEEHHHKAEEHHQ